MTLEEVAIEEGVEDEEGKENIWAKGWGETGVWRAVASRRRGVAGGRARAIDALAPARSGAAHAGLVISIDGFGVG